MKDSIGKRKEIFEFGRISFVVTSEMEWFTLCCEKKENYVLMMGDPAFECNIKRKLMDSLFYEIEPYIKIFKKEDWQKKEIVYRAVITLGNNQIVKGEENDNCC